MAEPKDAAPAERPPVVTVERRQPKAKAAKAAKAARKQGNEPLTPRTKKRVLKAVTKTLSSKDSTSGEDEVSPTHSRTVAPKKPTVRKQPPGPVEDMLSQQLASLNRKDKLAVRTASTTSLTKIMAFPEVDGENGDLVLWDLSQQLKEMCQPLVTLVTSKPSSSSVG